MTYGDYPDLSSVKKVLVVKLRQLGDVLLTGPVFSTLKKRLPSAQIDAYIYSESVPMLEGHPAIHTCLGYDRGWKKLPFFKKLVKEFQILRHIRKQGYDLVINLTEGDRGALVARISGASIRVGFPTKKQAGKLYTHTAKNCSSLRHTVERNLDALRRIGLFPGWEERELFLQISEEVIQKMRSVAGEKFLLIHPTSRWKFKCWPTGKMRTLAQELLNRGHKLVFTSGPDKEERAMVEEICRGLDVLNLSGQISLKELSALVQLSDTLICVDSLPFHIASALKKRVVAIFGPTSDVTWGPWRNPHAQIVAQNFSCRPCYQDGCGGGKVSDCLETLSVERVLKTMFKEKEAELRFESEPCGSQNQRR